MKPDSPEPPRPYHSPQRAAAAAQKRERVVAAARDLLAGDEGLGGFSLEAVAKRAGVTRLTVYHQFGSRRALLEAVFDDLAVSGGLQRIAATMALPDPQAALAQVVLVFCEFFVDGRTVMAPLLAAAASDPELKQGLSERNERRRRVLHVLVERMAVRADAIDDLVDVLWALTSAPFVIELAAGGRSAQAVAALVQALAADAVQRASRPR